MIAHLDFETYSSAGFYLKNNKNLKSGLSLTGVFRYAEHESTEILCFSYCIGHDPSKISFWKNGDLFPEDLKHYIENGGKIASWNSYFEFVIWQLVGVKKHSFPVHLKIENMVCILASARAYGLPGSLDLAGVVLNIDSKKDMIGKRLLKKFCMPRTPTKKDPSTRHFMKDYPIEAEQFKVYNIRDVEAEMEVASKIPLLKGLQREFWLRDQIINLRGVAVDIEFIESAITIFEKYLEKNSERFKELTGIDSVYAISQFVAWLNQRGCKAKSLSKANLEDLLESTRCPAIKEALSIRKNSASASVKKLYAMRERISSHGRLHELFIYHGARTGRASGSAVQPQNLPSFGPKMSYCEPCDKYFNESKIICPYCDALCSPIRKAWNADAAKQAIQVLKTQDIEKVTDLMGDPLKIISGCLRGAFVGQNMICSDYSAIEAVVLAKLAKEQWRTDVFNTHGKIYEMSASKISGIDFEEILAYKKQKKEHHPIRKLGKVAELASGYGGGVGAWLRFGANEFLETEHEIQNAINAWRQASPNIVKFWKEAEYNFSKAIVYPDTRFDVNGLGFFYDSFKNLSWIELLSGRKLYYHAPCLEGKSIYFYGFNSNPLYGKRGWVKMNTYGGRLVENIVQATSFDILANAIVNLELEGYQVVLHVHDEIVVEHPNATVSDIESIMSTMPAWAKDWPVKANGGWVSDRYSK